MNQIGAVLNLGFGLVLLWLVYYVGWRFYRIDNVRHDLFELRDELFLYAAEGGVAFKEQAYVILRRRIEALIRFAHTMTLSRVIIIGIQLHKTSAIQSSQQQWETALAQLPAEVSAKLRDIHNRVTIRVMVQMVSGNLALLIIAVLAMPIVWTKSFLYAQSKEERQLKVAKNLRVYLVEEQAVLAQECEPVPA